MHPRGRWPARAEGGPVGLDARGRRGIIPARSARPPAPAASGRGPAPSCRDAPGFVRASRRPRPIGSRAGRSDVDPTHVGPVDGPRDAPGRRGRLPSRATAPSRLSRSSTRPTRWSCPSPAGPRSATPTGSRDPTQAGAPLRRAGRASGGAAGPEASGLELEAAVEAVRHDEPADLGHLHDDEPVVHVDPAPRGVLLDVFPRR